MKGKNECPECGHGEWEYQQSSDESVCLGCGMTIEGNIFEAREQSSFPESDSHEAEGRVRDEQGSELEKLSTARNPRLVPPPESRGPRRRVDEPPDGKDPLGPSGSDSRKTRKDTGVWIGGEHEGRTGSSGEVLNSAEGEANREAASFLGLGGKMRGRTDAILAAERVCPPFKSPEGPLRDVARIREGMSGERLGIDQVITSIVMSKFSGAIGRSRPMRKAEDGWASNNSDWILWEIYAQLTLRLGRPWFIGRWANRVGLNTGKLHEIMPCSRECVESIRSSAPDSRLGPKSMSDLLEVFEGVTIHDSVPEIAERTLAELGDEVNSLGELTLEVGQRPVEFHHGIFLLSNKNERGVFDGSEYWGESEPTEFKMRHIPIALSLLQAMYDERFDHHPDGSYQRVLLFLQEEVERYTGSTWESLKSSWDEMFHRATGRPPFE